MDSYTRAFVKVHVRIDAGQRVWCKGEQLEVHKSQGVSKVLLPGSKVLYSFDDLKRIGARCDVVTLKSLAAAGAQGRWAENIQARRDSGMPSNVYVANARTVELAIRADKTPPPLKYVGRRRDRITEAYDTVDEVVQALAEDRFRTKFSKGKYARTGYVAK